MNQLGCLDHILQGGWKTPSPPPPPQCCIGRKKPSAFGLKLYQSINIVERYTEIPPQQVYLLVGKQKFDKPFTIDLRLKIIVNVFIKVCDGAGDSVEKENTDVICKSTDSFRYRKVKDMSQEKINAIEAMASERLSVDEYQICSKCERNVARKITKSDGEPAKKE